MADQDLERHLPATPYKLAQARRKGSVAKSPDVATAAVMAMAVLWCFSLATSWMRQWAQATTRWWAGGATALDAQHAGTLLAELVFCTLSLLGPLLLAIVIAGILAHLLQSGPVLSAEPLKPDFDRINPGEGFKRLFSARTLYTAAKAGVKLALLGGVFWWAFESLLGALLASSWVTPKAQALRLPELVGSMLVKLWLALLVLALIDLVYARWEYAKRMRMSPRELKDELKQREGDPRIRRRLRELRLERLRQTRALAQVRTADVVVTNPTRVAVALRYDRSAGSAPQVVAKGAGPLARRMRELAARHGVAVVQHLPLARALYRGAEVGGFIPQAWYPAVARILLWVYAARRERDPKAGR